MAKKSRSREEVSLKIALPLLGAIVLALAFYFGSHAVDFFQGTPVKNLPTPQVLVRLAQVVFFLASTVSSLLAAFLLLFIFLDSRKINKIERSVG